MQSNKTRSMSERIPFSRKQLIFAAVIFGFMGLFSFSVIRSAGPGTVLEAEGGEKTGNIIVGSDPNASGGNQQYVQFGEVGVPSGTANPTPTPAATQQPSTTPNSTNDPLLPGASSGFPTLDNTGPVTEPTKTWTGPGGYTSSRFGGSCYQVTQDVDGYIFDSCVMVTAPNVTISNSRIQHNQRGLWGFGIEANNVTIEFSEVVSTGQPTGNGGVQCFGSSGIRVYRNTFRGWEDPLKCQNNSQILENYITETNGLPAGHVDILQAQSGGGGLTIKGNTFDVLCEGVMEGCNGIILQNGHSNSVIEENYIKRYAGSKAGYLFHLSGAGGGVVVRNNVFNCSQLAGFSPGPPTFGRIGGTDGGGNRCE